MRVAFLVFLFASIGWSETVEEMLSSCRGVLDAEVRNGETILLQDFATGKCWGAFAVIQKAVGIVIEPDTKPIFRVCAPPEGTRTQLVAIFSEYVKRNPKYLSDEFFQVARRSLLQAFPCDPRPNTK